MANDDVASDRDTGRDGHPGETGKAESSLTRVADGPQISALIRVLEERFPLAKVERQLTPLEVIKTQDKYISQLEWGLGILGTLFLLLVLARR